MPISTHPPRCQKWEVSVGAAAQRFSLVDTLDVGGVVPEVCLFKRGQAQPTVCLFLSMLANNVGRGRTFYLYYGHISEATRQERPVAAYLAMSSESSHLEA
jgi:hypothetical protein